MNLQRFFEAESIFQIQRRMIKHHQGLDLGMACLRWDKKQFHEMKGTYLTHKEKRKVPTYS